MKQTAFLIFFSIVLLIYGLINFYIFRRTVGLAGAWKNIYALVFWLLVIMYPAGRILERQAASWISDVMIWTGSFWLAVMVYAFLWVLLFDIIRLITFFYPSFKIWLSGVNPPLRLLVGFFLVFLPVVAGYINANHPRLKYLELRAPIARPIRITFLSDIHLGTTAGKAKVQRITELVTDSKPDIVIFGGDVLDEDVGQVLRKRIGFELLHIKAPLGVFAVTGNHEYIGGASQAISFLKSNGIRLLMDEWVLVDSALVIAGRKDRDGARFGGGKRKTVDELTKGIPQGFPVVLIDHQPFEITEKTNSPVFLNLSGHTHHGQLWPLHLITRAVYEKSYGYMSRSGSHFYISCGAGTWGPPIRTTSRPEVVVIDLIPQDR
ncbi:MAG: metallophosphoesterase [Bacteroidales bacterium]